MVRDFTALGPDVIEVPLWWRTISLPEFAVMVQARQMHAVPLLARPGVAQDFNKHMADEEDAVASGQSAKIARQHRLGVLEGFNAKLNQILTKVNPGLDSLVPTPFRLHETGDGLTFWVESADIGVGDLLEMRYFLFAGHPLPMHGICQVRRLRREWSGSGLRVECTFTTFATLEQPVEPVEPLLNEPEASSPPQSVSLLMGNALRQEPSILEEPVGLEPEPPVAKPPQPPVAKLPEPLASSPANIKIVNTLQAGMKILEEGLITTAKNVPNKSPIDSPPSGSRRQDYRLNDLIPVSWKVISQSTFDKAVEYFVLHRAFPPRERVVRQKRLLMDVDMQLKTVKQFNQQARRPAVWLRERLALLFWQANSENEEEYYQSITLMFFAILRALALRPRGGATAGQILAHIKIQADIQEARDRMDPETQKLAKVKANADLEEIDRQIKKMLEKLQESDPGLVEKLKGLHESWAMMDLTMQDIPKKMTLDGHAVFLVNLSSTGLAWRSSKSWVAKGDLLEMNMRLSRDGTHVESVVSYGRVVAIQPPDESNRNRIACFFEHMTPKDRETVQAHIVRKQREELVRRSEM